MTGFGANPETGAGANPLTAPLPVVVLIEPVVCANTVNENGITAPTTQINNNRSFIQNLSLRKNVDLKQLIVN